MKAGIRKTRRIIYIFFVLLFGCIPVFVWGEAEPVKNLIDLDVTYGFCNNIQSHCAVPVKVQVHCISGNISGNIQVQIPVQSEGNLSSSIWMSDIDGRNNKERCFIWEREITMVTGESREEIFYIELPTYEGSINVSVISKGKVLDFEQISFNSHQNNSRLFVGVISEEASEIAQLNGMQLNVEGHSDEIFLRTIALTKEDIYENPLALEQLDILIIDKGTVFSKKQKDAISIWKNEGGLYYERETERLLDVMEYFQTGEEAEQFQRVLDKISVDSYYTEAFDEIPLKKKVPIGKYIFLILLYLAVVGPGLYWMLRGKREPYWLLGSVCGVACFFMFVLYLMGRSINLAKPTICHETLYEQKGDYLKESIDFSVQAYQMQDYVLRIDDSYQILPQGIGMDGTSSVNLHTAETVTFGHKEQENTILLENMSAYRKNCFLLEKNTYLPEKEKISFQISGNKDELSVRWNNPTAYFLKQAVVVFENRIAILGEIKPYSHGNMESTLYSYSSNGMSKLFHDLLDFSAYDFPEYEVENLSNAIWDKLYGINHTQEESFVIGILENDTKIFAENKGFDVYGTSLMKISVEINWTKELVRWCPNLETYGTVYKGEYVAGLNQLESRDAIVDYPTSQIGKLLSLEFDFVDYNKHEYTTLFDGKIYLFHWQMGMYSEVLLWQHIPYTMSLEPYISDTGVLRVYYVMEESVTDTTKSCVLPCIKVSGKVEENAEN